MLWSVFLGAALASCGGDPADAPRLPGANPIMGELAKAQYACMRNPADPRRAACCNNGGCARVTSSALPGRR